MAGRDRTTYGFRSDDADALLNLITMSDVETPIRRPMGGGGGGGGISLYRFTLNGSLASGTADADILLMDGTDTGTDATVRDPLGIFAALVTIGDAGLCVLQDGNYYVIQASCPTV